MTMLERPSSDCASAMETKCLSDGNKVLQRWKIIAIADAQSPLRSFGIAKAWFKAFGLLHLVLFIILVDPG
jgi:hypothetical protein